MSWSAVVQGKNNESPWRDTHRRRETAHALSERECRGRVGGPNRSDTKLVENALLAALPVASDALLEDAVELCLRVSTALFDAGQDSLFVGVLEKSGDICIAKRLERLEDGGCIEVGDRVSERRRVDVGLRE